MQSGWRTLFRVVEYPLGALLFNRSVKGRTSGPRWGHISHVWEICFSQGFAQRQFCTSDATAEPLPVLTAPSDYLLGTSNASLLVHTFQSLDSRKLRSINAALGIRSVQKLTALFTPSTPCAASFEGSSKAIPFIRSSSPARNGVPLKQLGERRVFEGH